MLATVDTFSVLQKISMEKCSHIICTFHCLLMVIMQVSWRRDTISKIRRYKYLVKSIILLSWLGQRGSAEKVKLITGVSCNWAIVYGFAAFIPSAESSRPALRVLGRFVVFSVSQGCTGSGRIPRGDGDRCLLQEYPPGVKAPRCSFNVGSETPEALPFPLNTKSLQSLRQH